MKHKLLTKLLLMLLCLVGGASSSWADNVTYTFTAKEWTSASGNWTGNAGSALDGKGVQCLKNTTYTVTSPSSLSNISSIVVTYGTAKSTTTSSTISIKVGSGDAVVKNLAGGSKSGATLEWTYSPEETGIITMAVTASGASAYIKSVSVTYDSSIPITSISMASTASIEVGGTTTLTPTVLPANTTETVTWESDNSGVATVSAGVVTGVAAGTATITAKSPSDATIKAECTVTVSAPTAVATPTMSVAEGTYNVAQSVTLSCVTDGATIRYTTDGTDPTSSSTVYSSAISVNQTMTIKAKAFKDGLTDSGIASATYTLKCVAPTFSPGASTLPYGTEITLSSSTGGSTIYYTTNGDTPTTSSAAYDSSNKPTINASQTIKAIAAKSGWSNSDVSSAAYDVKTPDAPTFSLEEGMVSLGASLTIFSSETGITIHYTTDGTTPTASVGTVYTSPITINSTQTVKAVAYDGGGNCSSVVSKTFTVFSGDVVTFTAGTNTGTHGTDGYADEVILSGVTISGTNAAFAAAQYRMYKSSTTTISVTSGLIKKIEFTGESSYPISRLSTATGTLTTDGNDGVWEGSAASVSFSASAQARATLIKVYVAKTAAPTFSIAEGEYSSAQSVTISCATGGAAIYYTTDSSTPTSSSTAYSSAISITETMTLKAIAINDGVESDVTSATYTMNRPVAPAFDVAGGVFDEAFDLHLNTETDDAIIYYTTDGTTPTTGSSEYSSAVAVPAATTTVKAIAVKNGLTSDISTATYTYDPRTTPTFTLSSKAVDLKVNVEGSVTLTTNHDGTITATSSDGTHMPVSYNSSTKVCTFTASQAGDYTITFSATGGTLYKDAEVVVAVSVTRKATTMTIETLFDDGKDIYTGASEGLIEGTVKYNDIVLSPQPTVTYSSSNTAVATVDEDGIITFVKAGSTTLTASFEGNDEYAPCERTYVLVLIDSTPQETSIQVTTNYTWLGVSDTGSLLSFPKEIDCQGVTVTISGGGTKTRGDTDYIRLYAKNTMQFTAPEGYYVTNVDFSHKTGSNTVTASSGEWNGTTHKWVGATSSVTFTIGGSSGNNQIYGFTVIIAETAAIGDAGYTTYVAKHDISFPAEVTAYISTSKTSTALTLTAKTSVPEGTPVILQGDAGTYALPTITTAPEDVTDNLLQASNGSVTGDGSTIFALGIGKEGVNKDKVGFYLVGSGVAVPAGKAYLEITGGGGGVKGFTFDFEDDDATSINSLTPALSEGEEAIYNLAGQRMNKMQKGINIVNGKKVMK